MTRIWGVELSRQDRCGGWADVLNWRGRRPYELVDGGSTRTRGASVQRRRLDLDVITDRGMAITRLDWRGAPLDPPTGTAHPASYDSLGKGWLRTWPAGFLPPAVSPRWEAPRWMATNMGIHGRAADLPARPVGGEWRGEQCGWKGPCGT